MEYEVFIDIFFLTDLFFNLLSLYLTGILLRRRIAWTRFLLSAAVGSVWNCLLIAFPVFPRGAELAVTILGIGSLMCFLAFGIRSASGLFRGGTTLFLSAAFVSGITELLRESLWLTDFEVLSLLGILCIGGGSFFRCLLRERAIGDERYHVTLHYRGACREFLALADSGNRLHVPGTEKPVSLASYEDFRGFCDHVHAGFYIPYRAVGTEQGLLFAVVLEKMEIRKDGKTHIVENPVVAVSKERLSFDDSFSMLLPEEYIRL